LVVPPLQPGAVGPYPVRFVCLPIRMPLEGVRWYLDFLGHNWRLAVPGIQDPNNLQPPNPMIVHVARNQEHDCCRNCTLCRGLCYPCIVISSPVGDHKTSIVPLVHFLWCIAKRSLYALTKGYSR
jgi:hypothetical protein